MRTGRQIPSCRGYITIAPTLRLLQYHRISAQRPLLDLVGNLKCMPTQGDFPEILFDLERSQGH